MGGNGSGYSQKDIKALKDAFKKELKGKNESEDDEGVEGGGLFALAGGTPFPIWCSDETQIDADFESGDLIFKKHNITVTISFDEYENEYSEKYGDDYCEAAEAVLADHI